MRVIKFINLVATAGLILLTDLLVEADILSLSRDIIDRVLYAPQPESRAGSQGQGGLGTTQVTGHADKNYDRVYLKDQEEENTDEIRGSATTHVTVSKVIIKESGSSNEEKRQNNHEAAATRHHLPRDVVIETTTTEPCSSTGSSAAWSPSTSTISTNANITLFEVPTSCTPISWTNTFAFTTDAACPTPYEDGTYCGFINPLDPCAIQPGGDGPQIDPDTPEAFLAYAPFHEAARHALTPPGYLSTFRDLDAATNAIDAKNQNQNQNATLSTPCYLGYHLLPAYDAAACAALCESDPSGACAAFNLYVERDPAWNPWRCSCDRPPAVTNYKCALFAGAEAVDEDAATNYGQFIDKEFPPQGSSSSSDSDGDGDRVSFVKKIVGSNGYVKMGAAEARGGGQGVCAKVVATPTPAFTSAASPCRHCMAFFRVPGLLLITRLLLWYL